MASNLEGSTIKFPFLNFCWQAELFENGTLAADFSDSDCSNSNFTSAAVFSIFNSTSNSHVSFVPGDQPWNGYLDLRTSSNVTQTNVGASEWVVSDYFFKLQIFLTSCGGSDEYDPGMIG